MQCDRAQEQFSDYIEDQLAPAMRQVFEQHLSVCAPCRTEIEELRTVYSLLGEGLPMVEPPPGFRAGVLNAISAQPAHNGFLARLRNSLFPAGVAAGGRAPVFATAAASLLIVLGGAVWLGRHSLGLSHQPDVAVTESSLFPWQSVHVDVQNNGGILQDVHSYTSADGKTYHVFGLHLPNGMSATNANAYVVQSPSALVSDAALQNPDSATKAWSGSIEPNMSVQVPVAVVSNVPAGTSMTLLVNWSDSSGEHKEVCFLPISTPPTKPLVVEAGEPLYQALEAVAVGYRTPIMLDDAAVAQLNQPITQSLDSTDTKFGDSLADLVIPANLVFHQQKDGSYLIDAQ